MENIWQKLPQPFFALAPMEQVTDTVFRQVIARCAKPDLFFTEFTNIGGMLSEGSQKVMEQLLYIPMEHPLIAQIWGNDPEQFFEAAQIIRKLGFDGIDVNMGCPQENVVKKGCGSGLIGEFTRVGEIVDALKKGGDGLPVSIKTRLGKREIQTESWGSFLLSLPIDALTMHARTMAEMSKVPAHWDEIGKLVQMRNAMGSSIKILGNGDILSRVQGVALAEKYGVDGIMVGRGIFQNIWFFEKEQRMHTKDEYIQKLQEHLELFHKVWGEKRPFVPVRKFFKAYIRDFPEATAIRDELMRYNTIEEVQDRLEVLLREK